MKHAFLLLALTVSAPAATQDPKTEPTQEQIQAMATRLRETSTAKTLQQIAWTCGELGGEDVDKRRACYREQLQARAQGGENAYRDLYRLASAECVAFPDEQRASRCIIPSVRQVLGTAFEDMAFRGIPAFYTTKPYAELTTDEKYKKLYSLAVGTNAFRDEVADAETLNLFLQAERQRIGEKLCDGADTLPELCEFAPARAFAANELIRLYAQSAVEGYGAIEKLRTAIETRDQYIQSLESQANNLFAMLEKYSDPSYLERQLTSKAVWQGQQEWLRQAREEEWMKRRERREQENHEALQRELQDLNWTLESLRWSSYGRRDEELVLWDWEEGRYRYLWKVPR